MEFEFLLAQFFTILKLNVAPIKSTLKGKGKTWIFLWELEHCLDLSGIHHDQKNPR